MIPDVEVMNAAVAFADVSGFTKLAEHYNSGGGAQMDIKGLNRELVRTRSLPFRPAIPSLSLYLWSCAASHHGPGLTVLGFLVPSMRAPTRATYNTSKLGNQKRLAGALPMRACFCFCATMLQSYPPGRRSKVEPARLLFEAPPVERARGRRCGFQGDAL